MCNETTPSHAFDFCFQLKALSELIGTCDVGFGGKTGIFIGAWNEFEDVIFHYYYHGYRAKNMSLLVFELFLYFEKVSCISH